MSVPSAMMEGVPLDVPVANALIGRAEELDRLAALTGLDDAAPRATAVLLSGDAGIGKTRLLAQLATRFTAHGGARS